MNKFVSGGLAVLLLMSFSNVHASSPVHSSDAEFVRSSDPVGGVYIATFDPDTIDTEAVVADVAKAKGVAADHIYRRALRGFSFRATEAAARAVCQHPAVSHVYEATKLYAGGAGSQSSAPWNLDRLNALTLSYDGVYSWAYSGAGVVAYVIDSGINPTLDLPASRIRESRNFVSTESRTDDCAGHGTYVAEVLGGATYGVAKDVTFASYRVLNCQNGWSNEADVAAAIDAMIATHAAQPNELAVANLSLFSFISTVPVIDSAVARAVSAGITVVTIAGNIDVQRSPSNDACIVSPGHLGYSTTPNGIITVAATDSSDSMWSGSKGGTCVDMFAPGANVIVGTLGLYGTSFAAPHVAGVVAMHLEKNANLEPQYRTPAQIENSVLGTAQRGLLLNLTTGSPNVFIYDGFPRRRPCC